MLIWKIGRKVEAKIILDLQDFFGPPREVCFGLWVTRKIAH